MSRSIVIHDSSQTLPYLSLSRGQQVKESAITGL